MLIENSDKKWRKEKTKKIDNGNHDNLTPDDRDTKRRTICP